MRPIHFLLGLVVVLASGASAYVATRLAANCDTGAGEPVAIQATLAASTTGDAVPARSAEDQIALLTSRLDMVSAELENLRNSANRAPAAIPAAPTSEPAAGAVVITPEARQTVLAVIAEEKAREAAEAEARRLQQEKEAADRRAARIAKELTLSPGDEMRLSQLMVASNQKRQELFEGMRNGNFDREVARTQFEEFRKWQTDQLVGAFGQSIADQILQSEGERFFGPGGPGGGPGGRMGGGAFAGGGDNGGAAGGSGGGGRRRGGNGGQNAGAPPGGGQ